MSLPKIATPNFFVELPFSKKELECRPYKVAEDKILLMAAQSKKMNDIANATRNVMNACVVQDGFDVKNIASVDADYLLMRLRAKSVGEKSTLDFQCTNVVDEKVCDTPFTIEIDWQLIKLVDENKEKRIGDIKLGDKVGIKLKPTAFESTLHFDPDAIEIDQNIGILYYSLDNIYDENAVYTRKDFTKEEFSEWVLSLQPEHYDQMVEFIANLPSLVIETSKKCTKCGFEHKIKLDNPLDFF